MKIIRLLLLLGLAGCARIPDGVTPVKGFDVQRYLGTWYEIARLDHSFERGLDNVTATYSLGKDGSLRIVNRGFDSKLKRWKEAVGNAYFVAGPDVGRLKVSFFRPFYSGYNIIGIDEQNYSYVLICGNSREYLWILARQPELLRTAKDLLIRKAKTLGFDTSALLFVHQKNIVGHANPSDD